MTATSIADRTQSVAFKQLMAAVAEGSEDALWQLSEQYTPHILSAVRAKLPGRVRPKIDSVDIAQMVWGSLMLNRDRLETVSTPLELLRLLASVAKNKVNDTTRHYMRAEGYNVKRELLLNEVSAEPNRRGRSTRTPKALTASDPTPSQSASIRERWRKLVDELPEVEKQVVALRARGAGFEAISQETGVSVGSAHRILQRVVQKFMK